MLFLLRHMLCGSDSNASSPDAWRMVLGVANVGDGWFVATEKPDYIQAIGLSSAKFQHLGPE